jgi:hypothetical protein
VFLFGQVSDDVDRIVAQFMLLAWGWGAIAGLSCFSGSGVQGNLRPVQHVASPGDLHVDILGVKNMISSLPQDLLLLFICRRHVVADYLGERRE